MFSGAIKRISARYLNPSKLLFTKGKAFREQLLILKDVNRKIRNPDCDKPTFIRNSTEVKVVAK